MTVNDLDRSLTFFAQPGFQVQRREGGFAIVTRDEITVHFTHHPTIPPEENNSVCRIVVSNIEALYQEILSIKALHPHLFVRMPSLTTQPWATKRSIWLTPVVSSSGSASPFSRQMPVRSKEVDRWENR